MPSPRKSSKSPSRSKSRGRSSSTSRTKTRSRSRSHSAGRTPKPTASEVKVKQKVKGSAAKSASSKKSQSIPILDSTAVTLTKTTVSSVFSSTLVSAQEVASATPVRTSLRMVTLREREQKGDVSLRKQQENSEVLSNVKTLSGKEDSSKSNSKGPQYEFMGPIGAFLMICLLPLTVYFVNLICSQHKCSILEIPQLPKKLLASLFEVEAALIFLAWFFFQAFLALLPVGRVIEGQPLKSGGSLKYRCNGFFALVVSLLLLGAAVYFQCPVTKVIDKFFKLMTTAILFSFVLSIFLYVKSRYSNKSSLAPGGNTGNIIYDFFIGRELNPRIGPLDLKFFCELRPGLIGWVVLDWIMVVRAFQETGVFPSNLVLVTVFQTLYVADALWFEDAILTTMDIIHDGFGFMLAFGDLAWVPFLYCLQPRFILENKFVLPWYCLLPIVLIKLVGYGIFRMSNLQKNRFRSDPNHPAVSGLETISTPTNRKLLVSGWWGICRKPNYLGDLIMALSWSLTTGFGQVLTYFYPIYFLGLLVHRERRDYNQCRKKYGASWDKYCERVKYRIFPHIY
uniref:Delta(14)-sterol reductase n=2 Tax=Arion vulgaris TaxID=1028688 RepID=A0A0B7B1M0_9EUPU